MTQEERKLALDARRAYQKEWRQKNPEKVKAAQERHWLKKAQQILAEQQEGKNESAD